MATRPNRRAPVVLASLASWPEWQRTFQNWMVQVQQGHLNNCGFLTLTADSFSTSVTDTRAGAISFIGFMPATENAAAELPGMYVSKQGAGFFVVTHSNNEQTDRTFTYTIMG